MIIITRALEHSRTIATMVILSERDSLVSKYHPNVFWVRKIQIKNDLSTLDKMFGLLHVATLRSTTSAKLSYGTLCALK